MLAIAVRIMIGVTSGVFDMPQATGGTSQASIRRVPTYPQTRPPHCDAHYVPCRKRTFSEFALTSGGGGGSVIESVGQAVPTTPGDAWEQ